MPRHSIIDLKQFITLEEGESCYKGYMIPGRPNWARVMISKRRTDGLIEAANYMVLTDDSGKLLWEKPALAKVQSVEDFERDLEEFRKMIEGAGLLIFLEDYANED
ncbi:MAG: hypothetical protein M0Z59_02245 [Nitrospiraceae bacterium]|nr:hypothetical protein [Nitrospiraceae bacterium]